MPCPSVARPTSWMDAGDLENKLWSVLTEPGVLRNVSTAVLSLFLSFSFFFFFSHSAPTQLVNHIQPLASARSPHVPTLHAREAEFLSLLFCRCIVVWRATGPLHYVLPPFCSRFINLTSAARRLFHVHESRHLSVLRLFCASFAVTCSQHAQGHLSLTTFRVVNLLSQS